MLGRYKYKMMAVLVSVISLVLTSCNLESAKNFVEKGDQNLEQVVRGWESREVVLDEKTIQLPIKVTEFESLGFVLEDFKVSDEMYAVKINDYRVQYPFILNAIIVNPNYRNTDTSECYVVGFSMNKSVAKSLGFKISQEIDLITESVESLNNIYVCEAYERGDSTVWESYMYDDEWKSGYISCAHEGEDRYFVTYVAEYKSVLDACGAIVEDTGLNITGNKRVMLSDLVKEDGHIDGVDLHMAVQFLKSGYEAFSFLKVTNDSDSINADGILINDNIIDTRRLMDGSVLDFLCHMSEMFVIEEVQYTTGFEKQGTYSTMKTTPERTLGLDTEYIKQCLENARKSDDGYKVVFVFDAMLESPEWDKVIFTVYMNGETLTPYRGILSVDIYNKTNEVYLVYNNAGVDVRITDEGDKLTSFESKLTYEVTYEEEVINVEEQVAFGQDGREVIDLSQLSYEKYPMIQLERGVPDAVTGAEVLEATPDEIIFKDKVINIIDIKDLRPVDLLAKVNKDFPIQYIYANNPVNQVFPEVNGMKDLPAEYFNAVFQSTGFAEGNCYVSFVFQADLVDPYDLFEIKVYLLPETKAPDYLHVVIDLHSRDNQVYLGYDDENVDIKMYDSDNLSTSVKLILRKYY